jgi:hypothetical protein
MTLGKIRSDFLAAAPKLNRFAGEASETLGMRAIHSVCFDLEHVPHRGDTHGAIAAPTSSTR